MASTDADVIILGAGLAGMTAAHELREHRVVVLESLDRVGGRTYSGGNELTWFNLGAQILSSPRLLALCEELGLDTVPIVDADFAVGLDSAYARAATPEKLFLKLPLGPRAKADFARAVLRLRRILHRLPAMSREEKRELDARSLADLIGKVSPKTAQMLNGFCEGAAGAPSSEVSALIGLAYGLGAYIDPSSAQHIRAVRGGTQEICRRIAEGLPTGAIRTESRVIRVSQNDEHVSVVYEDGTGRHTVTARFAISALPASVAVEVIEDLPAPVRSSMLERTPYSSIVTVAWPVTDGVPAPWDGMFFMPVSGNSPFSLFTNYSYLGKLDHPELGGHVVVIANAGKADALRHHSDAEVATAFHRHLVTMFPDGRDLIDLTSAIVHRWAPVGLPRMRPGTFASRDVLRDPLGRLRLCGDYTAEPGLPGANNSGHHVARQISDELAQPGETQPGQTQPGRIQS